MSLTFWPKTYAWAKQMNTICLGQQIKHMLGPKTQTHAWENAGNTCLAKYWKHMLGQMSEIYGLANLYLIKRGVAKGRPLLITYYLANPYISNIWPSMCFQHLAKHVFPAFAQACVLVFGPSMCLNVWPKHVFIFWPKHVFWANFLNT